MPIALRLSDLRRSTSLPQRILDQLPAASPRPGKYRNRKATVDGEEFDSEAEAARWQVLRDLEHAGQIRTLQRQVCFVLAPAVRLEGEKRKKAALRYYADFVYTEVATGRLVVEDVKGMVTQAYRAKRHLMATVHGIQITEINPRKKK